MTESDASRPPSSPPTHPSLSRSLLNLTIVAVLILPLLGFIVLRGSLLVQEMLALRGDQTAERNSVAIGYQGISPQVSWAEEPPNWRHDEGNETLLWAGWQPGVGHTWFRFPRGDLNGSALALPVFKGRDAVRAIDVPIVEVGGGPRWDRIPPGDEVVGIETEGVASVYPMVVLQRVLAINDRVRDRSLLVTFRPEGPDGQAVEVFDPDLGGRRLTVGVAGYNLDTRPVLYDRETQSLWVTEDRSLTAIAGAYRGARLPRIALLLPVPWGEWQSQYPRSRLVVGAVRSAEARIVSLKPGGP